MKSESWLKRGKQGKKRILMICMMIKYAFPLVLACLSYTTTRNWGYVVFAVLDVAVIMCLTNILLKWSRHFYWLNSILMVFVNLELGVLYFSGSVVTLIMIQSLNSVQDLAGNAAAYLAGAAAVIVFSFLPVTEITLEKSRTTAEILAVVLASQCVIVLASGTNYSTLRSVYSIYEQQKTMRELSKMSSETVSDVQSGEAAEDVEIIEEVALVEDGEAAGGTVEAAETVEVVKDEEFYKEEVADYYSKPDTLPEQPNVIMIFTEGLSQNIIDDERGIMPNVASLQAQSITFDNYYNHTFATYRGLESQLISGYQLEDIEPDYLPSVQSILSAEGYYTAFINTESNNQTFSDYLDDLGFDDVLANTELEGGLTGTQSDKEAYEVLTDIILELEEEEEPFFLAIYTVGTHATFDSTDEMFEDGTSNVLNRFYNVDYQFGTFFETFNDSEMAQDTILIFTTDHATFAEADFWNAFPYYERACPDVDQIPLSIYYEGVEPTVIDVGGRNSLDLAPTILDFMDVSAENYFLGESLFMEKTEEFSFDTIFFDPSYWKSTDGGYIVDLDWEQQEYIVPKVQRFFALKTTGRIPSP